jgi:signal transduction histidine kinase
MADDSRFALVVSLACHDLRTPLATIYGFARTLQRGDTLDERSLRFISMIEEASQQLTTLLDDLGVAARIEGSRFEPAPREADTLALATSDDERIDASGLGETIETEAPFVARALEALAIAAARYGPAERVSWNVQGRVLELSPVTDDAGPVLIGEQIRDLGSLVARSVIEQAGGSLSLDGNVLRVRL